MTSIEIQLAFDADLQPIGYALATEFAGTDLSRGPLPSAPDLFGWELAPRPDGDTPTELAADGATGHASRFGANCVMPWAVPYEVSCDQLLADDQLIEAVRAGRVDEHHPDPLGRLLVRWRTAITKGS
jgi:hypothetical protein